MTHDLFWNIIYRYFFYPTLDIHVIFSPFKRILPREVTLPDFSCEVDSSRTKFIYSSKPIIVPSMVLSLSYNATLTLDFDWRCPKMIWMGCLIILFERLRLDMVAFFYECIIIIIDDYRLSNIRVLLLYILSVDFLLVDFFLLVGGCSKWGQVSILLKYFTVLIQWVSTYILLDLDISPSKSMFR